MLGSHQGGWRPVGSAPARVSSGGNTTARQRAREQESRCWATTLRGEAMGATERSTACAAHNGALWAATKLPLTGRDHRPLAQTRNCPHSCIPAEQACGYGHAPADGEAVTVRALPKGEQCWEAEDRQHHPAEQSSPASRRGGPRRLWRAHRLRLMAGEGRQGWVTAVGNTSSSRQGSGSSTSCRSNAPEQRAGVC